MENQGPEIDVVCYDIKPPTEQWHPVLQGDHTMVKTHATHRTLFLCWPFKDDGMANRAVQSYAKSGGKKIVYVGELGDATGGERAIEKLAREVKRITIPCWPGINDDVTLYTIK